MSLRSLLTPVRVAPPSTSAERRSVSRLRACAERDRRDQRDNGERAPAQARLVEHHDQDQRDADQRGSNAGQERRQHSEGKQCGPLEHPLGHAQSRRRHHDREQRKFVGDLRPKSDLLADAVSVAALAQPGGDDDEVHGQGGEPACHDDVSDLRQLACHACSGPRLRGAGRSGTWRAENASPSVAPAACARMTAASTAALTGPSASDSKRNRQSSTPAAAAAVTDVRVRGGMNASNTSIHAAGPEGTGRPRAGRCAWRRQ